MKVRIDFNIDNAAFDDNPSSEVRNVCGQAASRAWALISGVKMGDGLRVKNLRDSNGNSIGYVWLLEDGF